MAEAPKTEMLDVSKLTGDGMEVTFILAIPGQGEKRYPMRAASMRVGRSDQSDIAIKDASVSSRHCDLVKEGGRLVVRDLGSSNGTFLNGQRTQEAQLNDGDVLRLGNATTLTVSISGGGGGGGGMRQAAPPPVDGSTAMISADQLDSMRSNMNRAPPPPPPAPRRTAAAPPPMPPRAPMAAPASSGPGKGLIIGIAVGVAVVIIGGAAAFMMISKSRARAADLELVDHVQKDLTGILATTPCSTVQDSVATLIKLEKDAGVAPPSLPVNPKARPAAQKFVDVERDKAKQYKRIATTVDQFVTTTQLTVDRIKSDLGKLGDETLKAKSAEITQALDDRMQLSQDFIGGWKRLQTETDRYADVTEAVFVQGNGDAGQFQEFHFSKQAPQVLGSCRQQHESSKKDLEEKLTALKTAAATK